MRENFIRLYTIYLAFSPPSPSTSLIEGLHQCFPQYPTPFPERSQSQCSDHASHLEPIPCFILTCDDEGGTDHEYEAENEDSTDHEYEVENEGCTNHEYEVENEGCTDHEYEVESEDCTDHEYEVENEDSTNHEYEVEKPLPNPPADSLFELSEDFVDFGFEETSQTSSPPSPRSLYSEYCVVCGDASDILGSMAAPCGHWYCKGCVGDLITAYINDESLHPLRCCKAEIPICNIELLLCGATKDLIQFREKHEEYSTPHDKRIYCPQQGCHQFIKPFKAPPAGTSASGRWSSRTQDTARCMACYALVCLLCKELVHPGEKCEENKNTTRLRELAKEKEWQTCSKCRRIVERIDGCLHMTCLCGFEFCYRCGAEYSGPGMCGH